VPRFVTTTVTDVIGARPGLQRVRLDDGSRAVALTSVVGEVAPGDRVIVNTTAVDLGLGTGGWHVVHWNLERSELDLPGGGHIMKLRYTSLQIDTGAGEEDAEPSSRLPDLEGLPVVIGGLHSQVGVVAAAISSWSPGRRVSYVMTDGAALPMAWSDLVHALRERDLLVGTVTAGHAFGGDIEAVSVASAIDLAQRHQGADVVIVAMGPGVVGTGSALGTTSVEVAGIADSVAALGGHPIVVPRASNADPRPRHRGLSHHTRTALALVRTPLTVALPAEAIADVLVDDVPAQHDVVRVPVGDVAALLDNVGLAVTTMGRGPMQDPLFFACAAAPARLAVADRNARATVTEP
jgi:hypothetical protein